ncbi:hypothetical protein Q4610_01845 [Sphingobium sp. HBC34]|uniref:Lipoprotein n=1 Tax=Sphingobium cyanobacteriorum TaxID=3063954 RepID=A0ABT8ZGV7_9SPHN|nr:hypothetical protein [Sphingobium sp. HBC34]MDO7833777.1 hypothetical protein [Sphingobium sp. HBC34]
MKYAPLIYSVVLFSGCAAKGELAQSQFDAIADKCGLPRSALKLHGKDELQFQPPQDAKYEAVDCTLTELKAIKLPMKMGFVGNELYREEAK